MRPLLAALLLIPATAGAQFVPRAPAPATAPTAPARAPSTVQELDVIRERIDAGRDSRALSRRDARRLRRETRQIGALDERYRAGGMSLSEQREIDTRLQVQREQVDARRLLGGSTARR